MPCIITTVHDPIALSATCRRLGLRPPREGCLNFDGREAFGWIVHLPGLHSTIVFETLTGLVAYHPRDNAFHPYGRIMRLILRYYDIRAELMREGCLHVRRPDSRRRRFPAPARRAA
jgi:hypothetical protein